MSNTEINYRKGLRYGGLPASEMVYKLEVTDPELVGQVTGADPLYGERDRYDKYARQELVDWGPDRPIFEYEQPRRDPTASRMMLNLRYKGSLGSHSELPQHPELFVGEFGNDPRGKDTGQPRLDQARAHMTARAREREVRMGHNVGDGGLMIPQRPWTGGAFEYDKKEMQRRVKEHMRWFTPQKMGRPWGRNVVADASHGLGPRGAKFAGAGEGLYIHEQDQPKHFSHWLGGDYGPPSLGAPSVRRLDIDAASRAASATAPWRHTKAGDTDLTVQWYHSGAGLRGRERFGADGVGGGRAAHVVGRDGLPSPQDGAYQAVAGPAARASLGGVMGAAAAGRRAKTRGGEQGAPFRLSLLGKVTAGPSAGLANDVAAAYRQGIDGQARRPDGEVQDDEGGRPGVDPVPGVGLGAPGQVRDSAWETRFTHAPPPNVRLHEAVGVARGLREGTDRGAIRKFVELSGARAYAAGERGADRTGAGRAPLPGDDPIRVAVGATRAPIARAAAAEGLVVHNYRAGRPSQPVALGDVSRAAPLGDSRRRERDGHLGAPTWRGGAQAQRAGAWQDGEGRPPAFGSSVGPTYAIGGKHVRGNTHGVETTIAALDDDNLADGIGAPLGG